MPEEPEDSESKIISQMFDEIMKMISEKQIKLESIVQRTVEQGNMQKESFDRIYRMLTDHGKKRQWISG
jgi:hypothetical protein